MPAGEVARQAVAVLLLRVIAEDAPAALAAAAFAAEQQPGLAGPDRVLFPALMRVALGLSEPPAGHDAAEAAMVLELADRPGGPGGPSAPRSEPAWPGGPLTESETRVLRFLPTHMGAPEIAAELCLSPNTVKTHLRHLYQKLGAHSRREAVQRARAIGLLATPSQALGGRQAFRLNGSCGQPAAVVPPHALGCGGD